MNTDKIPVNSAEDKAFTLRESFCEAPKPLHKFLVDMHKYVLIRQTQNLPEIRPEEYKVNG